MRSKPAAVLAAVAMCFLLSPAAVTSQSGPRYPEISELSTKNVAFRQYMQDIEQFYRDVRRGTPPSLTLYTYRALEGDTLMKIAARCSTRPETLATLNRIPESTASLGGTLLLLPAARGLFVPGVPENDLELLLAARLAGETEPDSVFTIRYPSGESALFGFYSDKTLTGTELAFFLTPSFGFPLDRRAILTSPFGMRTNPVTGNYRFHEGVDLAAPEGTPVCATRGGTVIETGYNDIYGNYIRVMHDNGSESIYGHLSKILVHLSEQVRAGYIIGQVGSTGQSTGPHLHFEIRINGAARDPQSMVSSGIKRDWQ